MQQVIIVIAAVVVATLSAEALAWLTPSGPSELIMVYVAGVAIAAQRLGLIASASLALASVLAFNIFFVEPRFTVYVNDPTRLVTFIGLGGVGLLISGLVARTRTLARAARQAESHRIRTTLLASMSHDLRTPLASVTGAATTLLTMGDAVPKADRQLLLKQIADESSRLGASMDKLLQMTRLTGSDVPLNADWNLPEEVVGAAVAAARSHAADAEVRITCTQEMSLLYVDAMLMETALLNLIDNAVRYGPAAGPVDVRATWQANWLIIEVCDEGPGVPSDTDDLFEQFVRGKGVQSAGTGLGLAIVRTIARLHGGTVAVRNREEKGACFTLRVPQGGTDHLSPPSLEDV